MEASDEIEALETEIKDLRARIGHCAHRLADVGDRLLRAKELVPAGEWIAWLEERVQFTRQTAWNYMRLARMRAEDPEGFAGVTLRGALMSNRLTSATCPAPERVAGRIDRLAERVACISGAPAEAQARALEAVERLRRAILAWTETASTKSA